MAHFVSNSFFLMHWAAYFRQKTSDWHWLGNGSTVHILQCLPCPATYKSSKEWRCRLDWEGSGTECAHRHLKKKIQGVLLNCSLPTLPSLYSSLVMKMQQVSSGFQDPGKIHGTTTASVVIDKGIYWLKAYYV